ncbi:MAG: hypothetical protein ACI854_001813 [Arenicella sp.]|jgi:hypothetical protein
MTPLKRHLSKTPALSRLNLLKLCVIFSFVLLLNACGDGNDKSETSIDQLSNDTLRLFISFEDGPNAGRHQYVLDGKHGSRIELRYNPRSKVTLLDFRGLISVDGNLRVDELQRFNSGDLIRGVNKASTWRGEPAGENKQCGVLNLRDHENTQIYKNGFAKYVECGATTIHNVGDWQSTQDSVTKKRMIKGSFRDRVKFQMTMDDQPFRRFETEITVEFVALEQAINR